MKKLLLMKNNLGFIKKTKRNFTALLIVLCGLFANTAMAQVVATTYTWTGATNNDWATSTNWTPANGVMGNTPGANTTDFVVINNGGNPTLSSGTVQVRRITINNASGPESGSTLTIANGATLKVKYTVNQLVLLNGGNIVNNGTLELDNSLYAPGTATTQTVALGSPTVAPASPTVYGYSGSGFLTINLSGATGTDSGAFTNTSANANTTYRLNFTENKTTITLATTPRSWVVRNAATGTSPIIIGGTGLTLGTVVSPVNGGLFTMAAGNTITVDTGTVLTLNSISTNVADGINITNNTAGTAVTTFTNKGTINILGATAKSGLFVSPSSLASLPVINFENQGIINVDISATATNGAALQVSNVAAGANSTPGTVNITNTLGAQMILKNNQPQAVNIGSAIRIFDNVNTANVNFNNNGTLNITGTRENFGGQTRSKITNDGLITSNQQFSTMTLLNNSGKTISFVKDGSTLAPTNALTTGLVFATNDGKIETATGSTQLNDLSGVAALSGTSSIEPGGAAGKGIASFSGAPFTILGTLKLQVDGNTAAGTDFDQVNNVFTNGGFTIGAGATLDVTGISGTATPVNIIVANGTGTISGTFTTVTGLTPGWSVDYSVAGKVQLVYSTLNVNDSEFNDNSVVVYNNNGTLYVNSGAVAINNIKVYDLSGRLVVDQKNVNANTASINNLIAINQVLIVKISGEDNSEVTKKVVF